MAKDYKVGYGRPPKHGRFKKGQSGNPKGRPKGVRNIRTELEAEFLELISIKEQGREIRVPKIVALYKVAFANASKGDPKALKLLLDKFDELFAGSTSRPDDEAPEDAEILKRFIQKAEKSSKAERGADDE